MRKSLSLRRESLAALTPNDLASVAGGAYELTHVSCNVTDACTHGASFDYACPTLPVNDCIEKITK